MRPKARAPMPSGMANVIANLAAGVSGPSAPLLLAGTGKDQRHLVIVATSDRGLAGGFNSGIVRAAREKIAALLAEGKDVKIITIGRKGRDQLRRQYGNRFVESYEVGIKAPRLRAGQARSPSKMLEPVSGRRIRRRHADLQPLQIGRHADPRPCAS